jgi:hypothetical protein
VSTGESIDGDVNAPPVWLEIGVPEQQVVSLEVSTLSLKVVRARKLAYIKERIAYIYYSLHSYDG